MKRQIKTKCLNCNKDSNFTYIGTQKDVIGEPIFDLYNCEHCGTTKVFDLNEDNTLEDKTS